MISYHEAGKVNVVVRELAKDGNDICGDAHAVIHTNSYSICAVIDGLGSGEGAFQSANAAIKAIHANQHLSVQSIVEACNEALLYKRGAVMTIIKMDYDHNEVQYSNVGNVGFIMYYPDGSIIQPISTRGYLSGKKTSVASQSFALRRGSVFVMYTDGLEAPPSKRFLENIHSIEEAVDLLFLKAKHVHDDVTVLVGKID